MSFAFPPVSVSAACVPRACVRRPCTCISIFPSARTWTSHIFLPCLFLQKSDKKKKKHKKEKKEPKPKKQKKDPNEPKRAKSSYMLFCDEHRAKLRAEKPDLSMTDISKTLGAMWKELSGERGRV